MSPWQLVTLLAAVTLFAVIWAVLGRDRASAGRGREALPPAAEAGAPDISNLSPREQFGRLADRLETAMESGDTGTVVRFFPMAEAAWNNLSATDRDIDARLHLAILRTRIGHAAAALAQADTIQAAVPVHLFGFYLRAIVNDFQGDTIAARRARVDFRTHFAAEIALNRPEYQAHRQMLDQFLATTPAGRPAQ